MLPVSPVLPSSPGGEIIFAKDQPQYIPLPVIRGLGPHYKVTSRWELTWRERLSVFFKGSVYLQQLTFAQPLQPVKLLAKEPDPLDCE